MTKRKRTRNDIAMAYRIDSLGYGRQRVSKRLFFRRLLQFLDGEIAELPRGWQVIWRWQNSKKQNWREDNFESVVGNSRDSFMALMRRRLKRDLDSLSPRKRNSAKRKKRKKRTKRRGKGKSRKMSALRKAKPSRGKARKRSNNPSV